MEPVVSPLMFYLMDFCDTVNLVCPIAITCILFIMFSVYSLDYVNRNTMFQNFRKQLLIMLVALIMTFCFVPSKNTIAKMFVTNTISVNDIKAADDIPQLISDKVDSALR